jgi:hypothetical protein
MIKLLKIDKNLHELYFCYDFLDKIPKAQTMKVKNRQVTQARWHTFSVPLIKRQKQEENKFEASMCYLVSSRPACLKKTKRKND